VRLHRVGWVAAAAAAASIVLLSAGIFAIVGGRPASAVQTQVPAPALIAGISTHAPCGDPVFLTARLKDPSGHSLKGVKVAFSFKLTSGWVRRHAHTNAQGAARVVITPGSATAPQGVRVNVRVRATYRGVHLAASTWFTPKYT
jgi:hypothetical protein